MMNLSPTTMIALDWAVRSFGEDHVYNSQIRGLRLVEEAVELAQALGITKEKLIYLLDIVYQRKPGVPTQEMGGVMMTATVLCASWGFEAEDAFLQELRRVLDKPTEEFTRRNDEKVKMGLTV
jgi:NTP pyrophosphatase (non-canonical NTP hydrolase)